LDVAIPMYLEDTELCYRMSQAGWRVYYLSEATIEHWVGQSTEQSTDRVRFELLKWRSYEIFIERYRPRYELVLFRLIVLLGSIVRLPVIAVGIMVQSLWGKGRSRYFTTFTFYKALALVAWSLGLRPRDYEKL
jgi:GT2 family glycosyltransferase